jgi:hypothetical protein
MLLVRIRSSGCESDASLLLAPTFNTTIQDPVRRTEDGPGHEIQWPTH